MMQCATEEIDTNLRVGHVDAEDGVAHTSEEITRGFGSYVDRDFVVEDRHQDLLH